MARIEITGVDLNFRVASEHQHRVLFWGILGAFVMRATLIITGTVLVTRFHWLIYLFGGFLVFTGVKMLLSKDEEAGDPEQQAVVRFARRVLPHDTRRHRRRRTGQKDIRHPAYPEHGCNR